MKKFYIILFFISVFTFPLCYGQDCATQKSVSDDVICEGQSASIILSNAEAGVTYELRDGSTVIQSQTPAINGNITFNVSPTTTTSYNIYIVPCGFSYDDLGVVTVNPVPDTNASVTSQFICSGDFISNITFGSSVAGTTFNWTRNNTVNVTGLPNSGSGDISGSLNNLTFSNQVVTFTITPISPDGCTGSSITSTVTVYPTPNLNITNSSQIRCSGAISTMVLSSSVPGTTFSWTRDNTVAVTGIANSGSGNISGSLTNNSTTTQTVTFTIIPTSSNNCSGTPMTATITVYPKPTATASITTQNICSGSPITPITFSSNLSNVTFNWTRNNTANVTGIPASGSGSISGTLDNSAVSQQNVVFTITPLSEDNCPGTPITSIVTVYAKPTIIASAPNQSKCSGTALSSFGFSNIYYSWTRDNLANVSGPTSGSNSANPLTGLVLSNTTNSPQNIVFTVTAMNSSGCSGDSITVTATVNPIPNVTANLSSQTICSGNSITPILFSSNVSGTTFSWTQSGAGIDFSGLSSSPGNPISGTLTNTTTTPRTATFVVTPNANTCNGSTTTVTVLVNPTPTVVSATNNNQTVCSGNAILPVTFTQSVASTTFNWTRDNTTNVTGIANSGSGNLSGILNNTSGLNQVVNFTVTPSANGCNGPTFTVTMTINPTSVGGTVTTTAGENIVTKCHTSGIQDLILNGSRGVVLRWESSTNGGITWTSISNTLSSYSTPDVTVTTLYRAVVQSGVCTLAYSSPCIINVIPNIKPTPVTATPATICNGDSSILSSQSGYATSGAIASGGTFSNSNPTGWLVDGCGNCLSAGGSNTNPGPWQLSATNGGTYSGVNYTSGGKFAIVNGAVTSYLYTPIFNTYGLSTASLTFEDAYNIQSGASIAIQISVNGGAYTNLWSASGPTTRTPYVNFNTNPRSIDLNAYIGQPNLRIRFAYFGNTGSSWAVDDIAIPDVPTNLNTQWVDATTGAFISNSANITVTPSATTTYAVTSFLNGCNSFGTNGTAYVTVTVNPRPTALISQDQYVCYGGTASFTVHFTGTGPYRFTLYNGTTSTVYNNITPNASGDYTFTLTNMTITRTYTITALNDSKCTSIPDDINDSAATVTVLDGTPGIWTGLVSTDWFDCKNWQRGLPSATIDAIIPSGSPKMPVIDLSSPYAAANGNIAIARDLVINLNASVTMIGNSSLHIKRDWKNSGTFNPGSGTVTFNSATNGMIQYMNAAPENNFFENYYNLTLNCTGGAIGVNTLDFFRLTVANNLVLTSGDLHLTGETQLVQNGTAANPSGGAGNLLRDQQGTKSSYHYNYWSSPVSPDNINYTVGGILKDGTNSSTNPFNPGTISFGDGVSYADGPLTSPIKISNRWIYKYTTASTAYASWQPIGSTGSVKVGEGFIMKGVTGSALNTDYQNYVFKGKPNSGNINLNIALNQLYLIGNPYPSALDADAFIRDNIKDGGNATSNVFTGALYFWDHFGGTSHYLGQYVGGYATYTLMGGTVAISDDPMINNDNSSGTKIPKRYIAVAQGFFIRTDMAGATANMTSPITGGPLIIKNSQRAFKTESPANSVFFKNQNITQEEDTDTRQKIRLSFESPTGLKRHLLVGVDPSTSNQFDIGYDGLMIDPNNEDMYWSFSDDKFVIQGVNNFNADQILPIGIKIASSGLSKIKIEALENIPSDLQLYLFDKESGIYHDLRSANFEANLPIGEVNNRFSLRFTNTTLNNNTPSFTNDLIVFVDHGNLLTIKNTKNNITVQSVELFNVLGQSVKKWNVTNEPQQNIVLPVQNFRSGVYIVNLKTSSGILSRKITIN